MNRLNPNSGYTLIELMIAMTIGLVVLGALGAVFVMQQESSDDQSQVIEMQENARAGMDIMSREILMAGYNPANMSSGTGMLLADTNQLQIAMDLNSDGDVGDLGETITFALDTTDLQLTRNTQPVAENIPANGLTFTYFDSSGNQLSATPLNAVDRANVRRITVSLTARTSKSDPTYGYRTRTLTADITPRNLGLSSSGSSTTTTSVTTTTTSSTILPTSSTDTSTTTTTETTTSTTDIDTTTSSTTNDTEPTTSSSTSSTTTTTTLTGVTTSTTTTTTLPCNLNISLNGCKPSGNQEIFATAFVTNNGASAAGVTVNWSINGSSQGNMVDLGAGSYGGGYYGCGLTGAARSGGTYPNKWSGTISATASKNGCTSATTSITVSD